MFRSRFYVSSPPRIQEFMISVRARIRGSLREGKEFERLLADAIERERWSEAKLRAYQERQLRRLLDHASRRVPYYRKLFDGLDFDPGRAELPGAMASLPTLSKRDIIEAGKSLLARGWSRGRIKGSTSGTTGTPVSILQDLPAVIRENSFITRQLTWAGFRRGEPRAWLRGELVVSAENRVAPFWRMNRAENMLMMSSYHLSETSAAAYVQALSDFGPTLIQAFPSSIAFLARYLRSRNEYYPSQSLRGIVTSSEELPDDDRRIIEQYFRCKVFDWYGTFERVAAIGTCEKGRYHLMTDYAYTELDPVGEGLFEIVGTGFNNYLMPMIRFRTGDIVELPDGGRACECGRAFPVIEKVHGRRDDYIKLSDGRRVARMGYIFSGVAGIAEAQIVQDEIDSIRIVLVPLRNFSPESERALVANAHARIGAHTKVTVEVVDGIPRTGSGKFRTIVCNL